jgi:hypothetical protein
VGHLAKDEADIDLALLEQGHILQRASRRLGDDIEAEAGRLQAIDQRRAIEEKGGALGAGTDPELGATRHGIGWTSRETSERGERHPTGNRGHPS